MADNFVGEIRMFAGDFAPRDWAFCDGRAVPVSQFDVLFSLIGTTYGGDGQQSFNLPDLRGRVPVHRGQGPGISQNYALGQKFGVEAAFVNEQQMPAHKHAFQASKGGGNNPNPEGNMLGSPSAVTLFKSRTTPETKLPSEMVGTVGGGQPHANRMPYLALTYIIALNGIYPPRS